MNQAAPAHDCKGPVLCRRCAAAYFGKSPDWFDDHVKDEVPSVVVDGRVVGFRREHLDRWTRLHTEGEWADGLERRSPSTTETTAVRGGSSSASAGSVSERALRKQIEEQLSRGRLRSGRKPKHAPGSLRLIPFAVRSKD
jgi:hypothetical protein